MQYMSSRRLLYIFILAFILILSALLTFKYVIFKKASVIEKDIALTFDDGPYGKPTQQILDILEKENIHATFFVVGKNALKYPDLVKREIIDGNEIANHSFDHSEYLATMSSEDLKINLAKAEKAIASVSGLYPQVFRAPYGSTSPAMLKEIGYEGYTVVGWDIDPNDWDYEKSPKEKIIKYVLDNAKPNAIVLLHDGRDIQINYPRDNTIDHREIKSRRLYICNCRQT
jgi:peptidoglycan/xylan/chitin deacetylase (PgdA/CDA1 family)